jgi:HAMP domain-containing protein
MPREPTVSEPSKRTLRGLTLAVLIPGLLFSAALSGWITYSNLYRVILNDGFEQKLIAVSTGVASFIDGDAHRELGRARRVVGLAAEPSKPFLWGLDADVGRLVRIDGATGGARTLSMDPLLLGTVGLAYDFPRRRLITTRPLTGEVLAISPDSMTVEAIGRIDPDAHALALDRSGRHLVAAGPWGIRDFEWRGPGVASKAAWTLRVDARAIAFLASSAMLYVLRGDGALVVTDTAGTSLRTLGALKADDEGGGAGDLEDVAALSSAGGEGDELFAAGQRLVRIVSDSLAFHAADYSRGYGDEHSPEYRKLVVRMRSVREALGITYLYTQELTAGDSIKYIVDSTPPGDDHSPIGTREALDTGTDIRGLAGVIERGVVYSSGIEDSEEWGPLKSAYAPIRDSTGRALAMVGTDVSVSTIQDRTQVALAKVGLVTVVILFLGGLGAVAISLRLTDPLAAMQEGATRVAAGRVDESLELPRLKDLAALTESFNEMTRTLVRSVEDLSEETARVVETRTRRQLTNELAARRAIAAPLPEGVDAEWVGSGRVANPRAVLVVLAQEEPQLMILWLRPGGGDPLEVMSDGEEALCLARRVRGVEGASVRDFVRGLASVWDDDGSPLLVIDSAGSELHVVSDSPVEGAVRRGGGAREIVEIPGGGIFSLPPDSELTLSSARGAASDGAGDEPALIVRVRREAG